MRPAIVEQRRQLADGRRLVNVVCPACEGRHWLQEATTGFCSRRNSTFTIATERTNR
jgi:hypothetical protein